MLDQISQLVKQYGQDAVVNNPAVPNEHNNAVMDEAAGTITTGLKQQLTSGNVQDLISMFSQSGKTGEGLMNNPAIRQISQQLIGQLTSKFNLNAADASGLSGQLIPNVLKGIADRFTGSDGNQGFNLDQLIKGMGGIGNKPSGNPQSQQFMPQVSDGFQQINTTGNSNDKESGDDQNQQPGSDLLGGLKDLFGR